MKTFESYSNFDVVVVGGGPAGLAAAIKLKQSGVDKVLVLERQAEGGGAPRHCGHPPFGLLEHRRITAGPAYASRLVREAEEAGVNVLLRASVVQLAEGPCLTVATPDGVGEIRPKKVLLTTGTRETTRGARFISGDRMAGICTTGTLQSMYYLKKMVPFWRPVIIGTEVVAYSALMTCRKAGIKPVAMVEEQRTPTLSWPFYHFGRIVGVPLVTGAKILEIRGSGRVESLRLKQSNGWEVSLPCDGVLFTGRFTPDASLARMSHLKMNHSSGAPVVDTFGRCSDPCFFAAGNLLQPVKMAVNCWRGGRQTANYIVQDLDGKLPSAT